jgi:pyruvate,water dikinase
MGASFAGVHISRLNVPATVTTVLTALADVKDSVESAGALSYRTRMAVSGSPQATALIQQMIVPISAGVLFTAHPITRAREFLVEAAWGFGEIVVGGRVNPDRFTLTPAGVVLGRSIGHKNRMVIAGESGIEEVPVNPSRVAEPSISDLTLFRLARLGERCEELFGCPQDIEWAVTDSDLWLTQSRSISYSGLH